MIYRWREASWEARLKLKTCEVTLIGQAHERPDAEEYHPTDFQLIERALDRVPIRTGNDVFLDVGCGKGRVLVMAAFYPFRKLLGIDLDPGLVKLAAENLANIREWNPDTPAFIECADAAIWPIPTDVNVVFLFNPFYGDTFQSMVSQLRISWNAAVRSLTIVYLQPIQHPDLLSKVDWLEMFAEVETWPRHDLRLRLYRPRIPNDTSPEEGTEVSPASTASIPSS